MKLSVLIFPFPAHQTHSNYNIRNHQVHYTIYKYIFTIFTMKYTREKFNTDTLHKQNYKLHSEII